VRESIEINAAPAKVWAVIGNFQDMSWLPPVTKTEGDKGNEIGATRRLTLATGATVDEELYKYDAEKMSYSYRITAVDVPVYPTANGRDRQINTRALPVLTQETLAAQSVRLGLQGRVNGSHLTSMHSMDNYYVSKLIPLMAEGGVSAIANPLINITLQGRHDTYPKRRGMTRVPELMEAGITVAFGHDCVMDPWYSLGCADMLEVASMGLHVAQMTGQEAIRACFDAVTVNAAKIMHLPGYGIARGNRADFVLLQARDPVEAIRLRATRLHVFRAGREIAHTPPAAAQLDLPGRPREVDWLLAARD